MARVDERLQGEIRTLALGVGADPDEARLLSGLLVRSIATAGIDLGRMREPQRVGWLRGLLRATMRTPAHA